MRINVLRVFRDAGFTERNNIFLLALTALFSKPSDCFEMLMSITKDSVAENAFVSILQHLLLIRDDVYAR